MFEISKCSSTVPTNITTMIVYNKTHKTMIENKFIDNSKFPSRVLTNISTRIVDHPGWLEESRRRLEILTLPENAPEFDC